MRLRYLAIAYLSLSILFAPQVWAQDKKEQPPQVEPKFVWGLLINYVLSEIGSAVFSAFKGWLSQKLTSSLEAGLDAGMSRMMSKNSGARIVPANSTGILSKDAVNTTAQDPSAPLKAENGKENYQGVQLSIGVADQDGKLSFRPLNQGFRTGERFKLHVIATFDGLMMIENINPKAERKQIYPAESGQVVAVRAGRETLIPLGDDQYFEFANATGEEQLVITLRDPRAAGEAKSTAKVNRKNEKFGSQFVQEVKPNTYPSLTEAIKLVHF